jgi:hypothetical protein
MKGLENFFPSMQKKITHHANVHISRVDEVAIIVTLHFNGNGGFLYQDRNPVVLSPPFLPSQLGEATLTALRRTSITPLSINQSLKLTDWPAFKASKLRAVYKFEQAFIHILISGANDSNLVYMIEGEPFKDAELHVISSLSSSAGSEKLGARILSVYRACCERRI